jgi:cobalamin biosynthesis protein CbiD
MAAALECLTVLTPVKTTTTAAAAAAQAQLLCKLSQQQVA